jgi:hypothetical protein
MKFYKLGLLTLLISLFILNSCKRQDEIGLGVDEDTQLTGSLFVDTSLVITTVAEDSLNTTGNTVTPLTYLKDPEFGVTETNIATDLNLPGSTGYTVPTGTVTIDSVVLVLPYAKGFYGDSLTSKYKVNVYQLAERINSQTTYYNTKRWTHGAAILGTKAFYAHPSDSLTITNIRDGQADTIQKVRPQIRISIDKNFVNNNLFSAGTTTLSSNPLFVSKVRGLYLTLDKSATTGPGGSIALAMDTSAKMDVFYKRVDGSTTDTAVVSLPISTNIAEVKHAFSAQVQAALNNTSTDGLFYLAGVAGTRARLTFPNVKNLLAGVGSNAVINRAELVIKVAPGTTTPFAPAPRLSLYKLNLAKQREPIQDASAADPRATNFDGFFVPARGEYHILITSFLQDLYRGKTVDYGTYISATIPDISDAVAIIPSIQVPQRTIGVAKNSPNRIKLNITYTKIK